jgi:Ty3 transposon capsid-like protein
MDTNSVADAMLDVHDLPQTYTPAPGAEFHSHFLVTQIEQLREDNRSLREMILSREQTIQLKEQIILQKEQTIQSLLDRQAASPATHQAATGPAVIHPAPAPTGTFQPVISRLRTKDPDVWSGTRSTLPEFLTACRAKFMIEEHNFPSEITKIGYAGSFLGGNPARWWHTLFQKYEQSRKNGDTLPIELASFDEFSQALTNAYGDPDLTGTMERELRGLRQTGAVSTYAAEYQRIAAFLLAAGWGDRALMSNYRIHLKDNIKNVLVHEKPFPTTLHDMIAASIRIDNREHEKILDRKAPTQANQSRSRHNGPSHQATASPNSAELTPATSSPFASNDGTTPMELDSFAKKGPLTDAERQYRREKKLCYYCGRSNHTVDKCWQKFPSLRKINFITEIPDSSDTASTNSHAQE